MSVYRDGKLAHDAAEAARDAKRRLLGNVRVASPCNEPWDMMDGDDRVRFCGRCAKDVYDVSAMTLAEAEAFIAEAKKASACVRLFCRADGTVITSDCPEGVAIKRRRLRIVGAIAGGFAALAACNQAMPVQGLVSSEDSKKVNAPIGAAPIDLARDGGASEIRALTDPGAGATL